MFAFINFNNSTLTIAQLIAFVTAIATILNTHVASFSVYFSHNKLASICAFFS
jgi:hypothetical protein